MRQVLRLFPTPIVLLLALGGCANDVEGDAGAAMGAIGVVDESADSQGMTATCAAGATVKGIDVSYYQETIDWAAARADGVEFAFIRVSDGVTFHDPKFARNWSEAKAHGVRRGAYQFFRAHQSAEEQADLLIEAIGVLEPGDLPPVIDVESTDGQSRSTIANKVQRWLDRVEAGLGVRPIVYTGPYFWRDNLGGPDFARYPLWIAHYGTNCPKVPPTWTRWAFHQRTDSGRVRGVPGNVDMNVFNGTSDDLAAISVGGAGAPAAGRTCEALPANGGIIDDGDACFRAGGDARWLRRVTSRGEGGDLITTGATSRRSAENFAEWRLSFAEEGTYELEVSIDAQLATTKQARYRITHADGMTEAVLDQSALSGFVSLGAYRFHTGAGLSVRLDDNTGESSTLNRDLVFDALRISRLDDSVPPDVVDNCPRLQVTGTGGSLNVRPEANTNRAPLGTLDEGERVNRIATVDGQAINGVTTWYRMTNGSLTGYVSGAYVRCVP